MKSSFDAVMFSFQRRHSPSLTRSLFIALDLFYNTVHNAMAALENQFLVAYNNLYSLEDALDMGFRGLMVDTCSCTGLGVQLCHSSCAIGYRRPVPTFEAIADFLEKNENEIVIMELQIGPNSFEGLWDKMRETNITSYMYIHPYRTAPWPIINDLVANNTVRIHVGFFAGGPLMPVVFGWALTFSYCIHYSD